MSRPLAGTELALFTFSRLSPVNLVVLLRLQAPALADLLPQALAAAQRRHPLLRARITGRPARPSFDLSGPGAAGGVGPIPLAIEPAADGASPAAVVEQEMNTPFDTGRGPLARLTYLPGAGTEACLVLTLQHAIADGASTANLVHELLDWCRARLAGEEPPLADPAELAPPLTDVLPASLRGARRRSQVLALLGRQVGEEIGYRLGSKGQRRPIPPPGRAVTRPVSLDRDRTSSLVDRARRQRLTMTSVLSAALLWQASAVLYRARPCTMRAIVWVDLRPHLDPPVSSQALGCYLSMLRFTVRVDPDGDFGALAATVQRQIERAARRGDRFPAAVASPALARVVSRWPVGRLGTTALSYAVLPGIDAAYGPIEVRDVRAFVSNVRLGAELAATAGMARGALWCNLLHVDSDLDEMAAAAVGDGLLTTLTDFATA